MFKPLTGGHERFRGKIKIFVWAWRDIIIFIHEESEYLSLVPGFPLK